MSVVIDGSNGVGIGAGNLTFPNNTTQTTTGQPTLMTAVTVSGSPTAVGFTGIPSWVKRITILLNDVSLSAGANMLIQVGAGSYVTTGYKSASCTAGGANSTVGATSTSGFVSVAGTASNIYSGSYTIVNISGNTWLLSGTLGNVAVGVNYIVSSGGTVTLSGALDRVQFTSTSTDTIDNGAIINVMYE